MSKLRLTVAISLVALPMVAFDPYTIIALDDYTPGATGPFVTDISNDGTVVGGASTPLGGILLPALWRPDLTFVQYPILPGYRDGHINAINAAGVSVGKSIHYPGGNERSRATMWVNGDPVDLLTPGLFTSNAADINDLGEVVGVDSPRGYHWSGGTFTDLQSPDGDSNSPKSINNSGLIAGSYRLSDGLDKAATWLNGQFTSLHVDGQFETEAFEVSESGTIVGYASSPSGRRGAVWDGAAPLLVHSPLGGTWCHFNDINGSGVVSGHAADASQFYSIIWQAGEFAKLEDLLPAGHGWRLQDGSIRINDAGQIVGLGTHNGTGKAFLMTPVPEANPLASVLALLVMLFAVRYRPYR